MGFYESGNKLTGFHKMQGISLIAEDLLASQEGPCSM